ncbi:MAG: Maf family protein [Bacteroidales bacterium]
MIFFEKLKAYDVILASQSPRRKELLEQADIPFRVVHKAFDEDFADHLSPQEVVMMLCKHKSRAFDHELQRPEVVLITADTIVVNQGRIINKPVNEKDAEQMLQALSGQWHEVYTGVCLRHQDQVRIFHEMTRVLFRTLTLEEIRYYVTKYKPLDKAGAYGIQEWIGKVGIRRIEGSYSNVVGLPVERVFVELRSLLGL